MSSDDQLSRGLSDDVLVARVRFAVNMASFTDTVTNLDVFQGIWLDRIPYAY